MLCMCMCACVRACACARTRSAHCRVKLDRREDPLLGGLSQNSPPPNGAFEQAGSLHHQGVWMCKRERRQNSSPRREHDTAPTPFELTCESWRLVVVQHGARQEPLHSTLDKHTSHPTSQPCTLQRHSDRISDRILFSQSTHFSMYIGVITVPGEKALQRGC